MTPHEPTSSDGDVLWADAAVDRDSPEPATRGAKRISGKSDDVSGRSDEANDEQFPKSVRLLLPLIASILLWALIIFY